MAMMVRDSGRSQAEGRERWDTRSQGKDGS